MPLWLQNLLAFLAVAACGFVIVRQALATLRGKPSKLGNCCAKGCQPIEPEKPKVAFIPSESLRLRRR